MQTPGIPDFRAVFRDVRERIWVEVKAGKNKPSPSQVLWLERELQLGGKAVVVYSDYDLTWALVQFGVVELDGLDADPHPETKKWVDLWRYDDGAWADELAEEIGL